MMDNLYEKTKKLCKEHKVYFNGMHLPLEECTKPKLADFIEINADVKIRGIDYTNALGLFFLNIRDLESALIHSVSECVLTPDKKKPLDYRDVASALGYTRNKKIDFNFGKLLGYLKNQRNLNKDSFNQLHKSLIFFQKIRNLLFHANTIHSFHINVINKKLYFNTSPIMDDKGVYANVYEVNKDFFDEINKHIKEVRFKLLEIVSNIEVPK